MRRRHVAWAVPIAALGAGSLALGAFALGTGAGAPGRSAAAVRLSAAAARGHGASSSSTASGTAATSTSSSVTPADTGGTWAPQAAVYGQGAALEEPVTAADGTVLRADEYFPTDPATGAPAPGPFPVLLQQTPYGKQNVANPTATALADTNIGYLVTRGFIVVIADVRGTGSSGGSWGLFDPAQDSDGATLARWAAGLAHADGKVGLFGESYMGINQFLTVRALGPQSPVKAIFPVIAGNDLYRDAVTQGGLLDTEFSAFYMALVNGLNSANPVFTPLEDASATGSIPSLLQAVAGGVVPTEMAHAGQATQFDLPVVLGVETGGDLAYDQAYWAARNPADALSSVVADGIPAFLVGGWHDLFQRGELLNYTALQNAFAGRPPLGPMPPGQPATPRYQLLMGNWQHVTTGQGIDLARLELEWFDQWLSGTDTPLAHSTTPLHLYQLQSGKWFDTATWPAPAAPATRYYLAAAPPGGTASGALSTNDGSLTTIVPTPAGADPVAFTGLSSACDLQSDQWGAGALALAAGSLGTVSPCDTNDLTLGTGPGALTYTSGPMASDQVLAGPVDATVYATSTTPDTVLVATVEEVSPSGQSVPVTSGALLGSLRRVDAADSWLGSNGDYLLPYHPYTAASQSPVEPGRVTRYDIEVFPTFAEVPAGWRLRLTLTTADTPHLAPTLAQLPQLVGGVYQVQRGGPAASFVNLPLAPAGAFATPCGTTCS
jgi:putative CocE/NonD family hydrolase